MLRHFYCQFPGDELRQKIETERCEIERLRQEIAEIQEIRDDLGDDDDSSSVSSDSSEDEEELREVLKSLIMENKELEVFTKHKIDKNKQKQIEH